MTKTRKLVRDLLSLINKSQLNDQQTTKIKSLTIKMVTQQFEQCIRHQNYDTLLTL